LGHQRQYNYALQCKSKEEFIEQVTAGLEPPPQYFPKNVMLNKKGYDSIDDVYEKGMKALNPDEFETLANELHALVLDTRSIDAFGKMHIPNSIFIGLDGQFAPWVGALITDLKQPILFIADEGREQEVITRLARVGYDNTLGYLKGGLLAWKNAGKEIDVIPSITAKEFDSKYGKHTFDIIDVRRPSEYDAHHILDSKNEPLDYINDWINQLDRDKTYYIHCAGGYRSMITASILKSRGWHNLINIGDGFAALEKTTIPMTEYICPLTTK
jgi:rhodanese-related sulfurtransferase